MQVQVQVLVLVQVQVVRLACHGARTKSQQEPQQLGSLHSCLGKWGSHQIQRRLAQGCHQCHHGLVHVAQQMLQSPHGRFRLQRSSAVHPDFVQHLALGPPAKGPPGRQSVIPLLFLRQLEQEPSQGPPTLQLRWADPRLHGQRVAVGHHWSQGGLRR